MMTMATPALGDTDGQETVEYILMLHSAGFIESPQCSVYRISWAAYELLHSVRGLKFGRRQRGRGKGPTCGG
jgi:hypothetical protein